MCLDAFYEGVPDGDALAAVAAAGVTQFEFWDWRGRDLEAVRSLDVHLLVAHTGYALPDRNRGEQWAAAVVGLRAAGDLAASVGVRLAVEPLNSSIDHPGYFLNSLSEADLLLREVNHPAVRLLLDVYHMWVMHDDLLDRLVAVAPMVVHVHAADVPGRGEPGSGVIPWPEVMACLRAGGYEGSVGLECWPTGPTHAALQRSAGALAA